VTGVGVVGADTEVADWVGSGWLGVVAVGVVDSDASDERCWILGVEQADSAVRVLDEACDSALSLGEDFQASRPSLGVAPAE
jgi:hypothetical protein